jgi:hypothetical protein
VELQSHGDQNKFGLTLRGKIVAIFVDLKKGIQNRWAHLREIRGLGVVLDVS